MTDRQRRFSRESRLEALPLRQQSDGMASAWQPSVDSHDSIGSLGHAPSDLLDLLAPDSTARRETVSGAVACDARYKGWLSKANALGRIRERAPFERRGDVSASLAPDGPSWIESINFELLRIMRVGPSRGK